MNKYLKNSTSEQSPISPNHLKYEASELDQTIARSQLNQFTPAKVDTSSRNTKHQVKLPHKGVTQLQHPSGMIQQNVWMVSPQPYQYEYSPMMMSSPLMFNHGLYQSEQDYLYRQQLDNFVKDVKINKNTDDLDSARRQLRELNLLLKLKDEQIIELKRQLHSVTQIKDQIQHESHLMKIREDQLHVTVNQLQNHSLQQAEEREYINSKLIHEQEYSSMLRQENNSLKKSLNYIRRKKNPEVASSLSSQRSLSFRSFQEPVLKIVKPVVISNGMHLKNTGDDQYYTTNTMKIFSNATITNKIHGVRSPVATTKPMKQILSAINKPRGEDPDDNTYLKFTTQSFTNHKRCFSSELQQPKLIETNSRNMTANVVKHMPEKNKQQGNTITGSFRRGATSNQQFINRNLISKVQEALQWNPDTNGDEIDEKKSIKYHK